ncbi:dTDP-4-amino-4,6-dideoxygalactose transaminase [Caldisalinibacter kiritimatiensis]|uniref:4-keto-6-deoxy-N-Acetyl-D-hexosaminyl-(Lipid carrier) aminotransferase n=1 Tax=Caldisalinibacter kiritimatiensis TaxID=1304284 RepID=R1AVZ6_9FIRM|nr:dTDP-4-amino-4,6-dideoxygalactose transaminase [Caldisalinibacter kiritimatiensis]EOD00817.1 4-keto-6-deoxy-N-Acetyl-D-hexosaminyl-(Lipid carrier) aminotransferase [Caldisalinibacter kiritimatiensis]
MKIPFNKIYLTGNELKFIEEAFNKESVSGDGYFTSKVSSFLEEVFSIPKVLMTTSATHALDMAMMLINLGPKDEVIMPSFTFPSTANSVMLQGATPVFADILPTTLNINPDDLEKRITKNTKAIIPVHYGGVGCEMDRIINIANKYNLYIIEDAAQAVNSKYKDKFLGTWGHLACYSFHGTKNYISGEGGALVINSKDDKLIERAEIIRQKGTNRNKFLKGEVDKYTWVDIGSSYTPSDILMALLYGQLQHLDVIKERRGKIVHYYIDGLNRHLESGLIKGMTSLWEHQDSNHHLFYIILDNETIRDKVINKLRNVGIYAATHFEPLHSSSMGQGLGYKLGDLPITERVSKTLLRLPLYTNMTIEEADYVVHQLDEILKEI